MMRLSGILIGLLGVGCATPDAEPTPLPTGSPTPEVREVEPRGEAKARAPSPTPSEGTEGPSPTLTPEQRASQEACEAARKQRDEAWVESTASSGPEAARAALRVLEGIEPLEQRCGKPIGAARTHWQRSESYRQLGDQQAQLRELNLAEAQVEASGMTDSLTALWIEFSLVELRHDLGDISDGGAGYLRVVERLKTSGKPDAVPKLLDGLLALSVFAQDEGEVALAIDRADEVLSGARALEDEEDRRRLSAMALARLAELRALTGDLEGARDALSRIAPDMLKGLPARNLHIVTHARGVTALHTGDLGEARGHFRAINDDPAAEPEARWRAREALARVQDLLGKSTEARRLRWEAIDELAEQRRALHGRFLHLASQAQRSGLYDDWIDGLVRAWESAPNATPAAFEPGRTFASGPIDGDALLAAVESVSSRLLAERMLRDRGELDELLSPSGFSYHEGSGWSSGEQLRAVLQAEMVVYIYYPLPSRLLVLKVSREQVGVHLLPYGREQLEVWVRDVGQSVLTQDARHPAALQRVGDALLTPVQWPEHPDQVVGFSLMGELESLPIGTLRTSAGYVVERCAPVKVPSLTSLGQMAWRGGSAEIRSGLGVAYGDGLLAALAEVQVPLRAGLPLKILTDATASVQAVTQQMPRVDLVHVAAHGVGAVRPGPDGEPGHEGRLSLADGELSASALQAMRLRDVKLMVLGACETGLGRLGLREYGFGSLERAGLEAGAQRVLSTQWKINDMAAIRLMESFYAHWPQVGAAVALARAQRAMITNSAWSGRGSYRELVLLPSRPRAFVVSAESVPLASPWAWGAVTATGRWD